ncbi:MAG: FecR domain-containing protein [Lachnospiraceae bacterium]|nr:FecR domain-containing protein [Candidatus Colinaster scatohippi]
MRESAMSKRFICVLMVVCLFLTGSISVMAVGEAPAKKMVLSKQEGTVAVYGNSRPQKARDNMEILNGYHVVTGLSSYAWIQLDDTKLVKQDALSKTVILQDGNNFAVDILSGSVFLDIAEQLEEDTYLTIRTPDAIVGIVGASGTSTEIRIQNGKTQILCLEGKVQGFAVDSESGEYMPIDVLSGKIVSVDNDEAGLDIEAASVTMQDVSGFTKVQLAQDSLLNARIVNAIGENAIVSIEEATASLQQDTIRQLTEIESIASSDNMDKQSAINAILGIDMSEKALSGVVPTSKPSEPKTEESSDNEVKHIHEWVYVETVEEPTCTEDGTATYKCKTCLETKIDTFGALGHSVESIEKTRVVEGAETYYCTEIIIADFGTCSRCHVEVEVSRRQKYDSHSLGENPAREVPETCTENKLVTYECDNRLEREYQCTYFDRREVEGTARGHVWSDNIVGSDGSYSPSYYCDVRKCNRCEEKREIRHNPGDGFNPDETYDSKHPVIFCQNEGCNKVAKYVQNETGLYQFSGKWVDLEE